MKELVVKFARLAAYCTTQKGIIDVISVSAIFTIWLYLIFVAGSTIDIIVQPLCWYLGYRLGSFGLLGFVPFGKWIHNNLQYVTKYNVAPGYRWRFITEMNFKIAPFYTTREMIPGDPSSSRDTTNVDCFVIYFGFPGLGYRSFIFSAPDIVNR